MENSLLKCNKCWILLVAESFNSTALSICPSCNTSFRTDIFPALFRREDPDQKGEKTLLDDEPSCFFHPKKKAVVPCAICGRFLCALCDVEFSNQHLCASCIESGRKRRKIKKLENHRVLYDNVALSLAIIPILFVWPTIITAPASMFIAIRYWKAPSSMIPRTKIRNVIAILFAGLQITGWTLFIGSFFV